jgi:uncharacterized protein (TIGR03067 family)
MKTSGWFVLSAFVFTGLATAQEESIKEEIKKFQGTWKVVHCQTDNADAKEFDKEIVATWKFTFAKNNFRIDGGKMKIAGTFSIQPAQKPKQIDMVSGDPKEKVTLHAIYEFAKETLRLRGDERGRPKNFEFGPSSSGFYMVLKKVK